MDKSLKNRDKTPGVSFRKLYKAGNVTRLQQKMWRAVEAAEALLYADGVTFSDQISAVHALVQAGQAYAKLLQTTDLQAQLDALQDELLEVKRAQGLRRLDTDTPPSGRAAP